MGKDGKLSLNNVKVNSEGCYIYLDDNNYRYAFATPITIKNESSETVLVQDGSYAPFCNVPAGEYDLTYDTETRILYIAKSTLPAGDLYLTKSCQILRPQC